MLGGTSFVFEVNNLPTGGGDVLIIFFVLLLLRVLIILIHVVRRWCLFISANWQLFSALADQSVVTAAGLHVDNGTGVPHHSIEFPMSYQGFGGIDNAGMMISDMYQMDPSLVDPAAMQHMLQTVSITLMQK